jgi:GNAT superfamily N-acetyltransferase
MTQLVVRQASVDDSIIVSDTLAEVSRWLAERDTPMWKADELSANQVSADVGAGLFFIGEFQGRPACVVKFQLEDRLFWPDIPQESSAFIHRLAVRREFAGGGISTALLRWAAQRAHLLGRSYLRLDCEASRAKLRAIYEHFGFVHHSDRHVGPYFVSRYELDVTGVQSNQSSEKALSPGKAPSEQGSRPRQGGSSRG